jgi:hypothetical protein
MEGLTVLQRDTDMAAFTKGDIRINRNGRPRKGKSLTEALERELRKKRDSGKTGKAELAKTLVDLAISQKDIAAIKYVYDRIDGRPKETVELTDGVVDSKLMEVLNDGQ